MLFVAILELERPTKDQQAATRPRAHQLEQNPRYFGILGRSSHQVVDVVICHDVIEVSFIASQAFRPYSGSAGPSVLLCAG